mgnify:CR=1 FL=1
MMGAGKSTIGRLIAKRLNVKFIDIDKIIEKNEKKTIKRIFDENGEKYFRVIEEKITINVIKNKIAVIALGGGAFINNKVREKVLKTCVSVWLKVNIDNLTKRYNKNNRRPLLNKNRLEADVKKIYQSRKKIYSLANFKINCDNIDKGKIVQKIIELYGN